MNPFFATKVIIMPKYHACESEYLSNGLMLMGTVVPIKSNAFYSNVELTK